MDVPVYIHPIIEGFLAVIAMVGIGSTVLR